MIADVNNAADPDKNEEALERLYPNPISPRSAEKESEFLQDWHDYVTSELTEKFNSDVKICLEDIKRIRTIPSQTPPPLSKPGLSKISQTIPPPPSKPPPPLPLGGIGKIGAAGKIEKPPNSPDPLSPFQKGQQDKLSQFGKQAAPKKKFPRSKASSALLRRRQRRFHLEVPNSHADAWYSALNQARILLSQKQGLHEDGPVSEEMLVHAIITAGEKRSPELRELQSRWKAYVQSQVYAVVQEWLVSEVIGPGIPGFDIDEEE